MIQHCRDHENNTMPIHNLFAAVWKVKPPADLSLDQRKVNIINAMNMAYGSMLAASQRMKASNPVYLFTTPEYYWTKSSYHPCSELEKTNIYSAMASASANLSSLIIFPGTVNWQVPLAQHKGPEPAELKDKKFVGYNTAPVYLGGNCLLDYYKKWNDKFLQSRPIAAFSAGTGVTQSFSANGLSFGLDVCGDLNAGELNKTLAGTKVDVMVVLSGSVAHKFGDAEIEVVPVRDGGAFIHCDDSGLAEKNGLWVLSRGKGWHGSAKNEITLAFDDLDNSKRVIAFPMLSKDVPGPVMTVTAVGGFGGLRTLNATVNAKGNYIKKFTMVIPGGRAQTAVIELHSNDNNWEVKLTRPLSLSKSKSVMPQNQDTQGMRTTGRGNVSRIGKLFPAPNDANLDCYTVPIEV